MDLKGIILSEVTHSQKNSHDMHSLISGYSPRNLEYLRDNLQNTWNSSRRKTKLWILHPSLEWGAKYPCKELQRQSLEFDTYVWFFFSLNFLDHLTFLMHPTWEHAILKSKKNSIWNSKHHVIYSNIFLISCRFL